MKEINYDELAKVAYAAESVKVEAETGETPVPWKQLSPATMMGRIEGAAAIVESLRQAGHFDAEEPAVAPQSEPTGRRQPPPPPPPEGPAQP